MFARARIIVALAVPAALALLSSCDLSQKTPETIGTVLTTQRVTEAAAAGSTAVQVQAPFPETTDAEGPGHERSVRLYGPGVSRDRQTRI